ncbi:MAG: hypothetical protein MUF83_02310 [Acidimicrobiales bacterium]|nr:hypothetical protein [Acidimicrobiales bacterium]
MTAPLLPPPPFPPTRPPRPPEPEPAEAAADRSRAGAVWVTGTGAFLLFCAAAVFVAVRWEQIPEVVKLAVAGTACGASLLAGRRLRPDLPATASALEHLGAFLVAVVGAAIGVHLQLTWPALLLATSALATASWATINRGLGSVVLSWATAAAVVTLALGIGATTPVPASVALVAAAVAAEVRSRHGAAIAWAAVAGLGPVASLATHALAPLGEPDSLLARLESTAQSGRLVALAVGVASAGVLARNASRRADPALALVAIGALVVGIVDAWLVLEPGGDADATGLAALVVAVELAALALRRDRFWGGITAGLAVPTEIGAALATALLAVAAAARTLGDVTGLDPATPDGWFAGTALLLAVGWYVADLRRVSDPNDRGIVELAVHGRPWPPASWAMATATVAAAVGGVAPVAGAATALAVAVAGTATRRVGAALTVALASCAPLLALGHPWIGSSLGGAGALLVAWSATRRCTATTTEAQATPIWLLALAALVPALIGAASVADVAAPLALLGGWVVGCWGLAAVLDRGERSPATTELGAIARVGGLLALVGVPVLAWSELAWLATLLAVLALVDALRRDQPVIAVVSALATPTAVAATAAAHGAGPSQLAVLLALVAAGALALDGLLEWLAAPTHRSWQLPVRLGAVVSAAAAIALAQHDETGLGVTTMLLGASLAGAGLLRRSWPVVAGGWTAATVGAWLTLDAADVAVSEPYVAPVAVGLVVAGARVRRTAARAGERPTTSWVAYTPALLLLGVPALAERVAGGAGIHAVVAGAVGLLGVAVGGARRLVGPLVAGTVLVVCVAGYETLAVTAGVPTWAWLAAGGVALLGAGIAMERTDSGPLESGRRLVDVVSERFS